jgi:hypothetical protein
VVSHGDYPVSRTDNPSDPQLPAESRTGFASSFIGPRFAHTVMVTQHSRSLGECRGGSATRGPTFPANRNSDPAYKETPD